MADKTLLIVWVYFPAVGHLVEAIEVAANYKVSNPNLEIHLLVNSSTPFKIASYCSFIEEVHILEVNDDYKTSPIIFQLKSRSFEYVVFPKRLYYIPKDFTSILYDCNQYLKINLVGSIWTGYNDVSTSDPNALCSKSFSSFKIEIPNNEIRLNLPDSYGYPKIAVMLKGASNQSVWPSLKTWNRLLLAIKAKYPKAQFYITGITAAHLTPKTSASKIQKSLSEFVSSIPDAFNFYDVGLDNQLGLIQHVDVFLSPHTGFAFLAPCLGTPWLALSGGQWSEHMPAKMPFYSVLPSCSKYPCHSGDMKLECRVRLKLKQPIKCMSNLIPSHDNILVGLKKLLDINYTFENAFQDYEQSAIEKKINIKKIWRLAEFKNS